jgi:hypothetical protein
VKGFDAVSRGSPRDVSRGKVVRVVSRGVRLGRDARGIGVAPGMTIASDGGTMGRERPVSGEGRGIGA